MAPHDGFSKRSAYFDYELDYHHFNVTFDRMGWVPERGDDGLEYYRYKLRPFTERVNRVGGNLVMGLQTLAVDGWLLFDFYSGVGYHNSSIKTDFNFVRYDHNATDFGHTGVYFVSGMKVGIVL
ncbi:MAG: hypothetical protein LPK09_08995 [Hymenobacteraceae bacterium]|nr:hypothetical protein [Hymenobacteraceae bacterium]